MCEELFRTSFCILLKVLISWCVNYIFGVACAKVQFDPLLLPPSHMPVAYGPVKSRKAKAESSQKDNADDVDAGRLCAICKCKLLVLFIVFK